MSHSSLRISTLCSVTLCPCVRFPSLGTSGFFKFPKLLRRNVFRRAASRNWPLAVTRLVTAAAHNARSQGATAGLLYPGFAREVRAMIATAENIAEGIEQRVEPVENSPEGAARSTAANGKLPPTERDFEIYREVVLQGESTRHVAGRHGLSQTRVRQLLTRVIDFLLQAVPVELPEQTREQRLYVAEQLARMHLEHLYRELLQMWQASQRASGAGGLGKASYLTSAARVVGIMAKLPVHQLPAFAPDPDEPDVAELNPAGDSHDEPHAPLADLPKPDPQAKQAVGAMPPPVRACSANAVSRGPVDPTDFFAKPTAAPTYAPPSGLPPGPFNKNFAPAQSARLPARKPAQSTSVCDSLASESQIDIPLFDDAESDVPCEVPPDAPGSTLTRQQRRSRERLLRQKLGK